MTNKSILGCILISLISPSPFCRGQEALVSPQTATNAEPSAGTAVVPSEAPVGGEAAKSSPPGAIPASNHPQIVIVPEVELAKEMFFRGAAQGFGALFGVVGALATYGAEKGPREQMVDLMAKEQIAVPAIVLAEADSRIGSVLMPESYCSAEHPGSLKISIPMYGFVRSQPLSSKMYPTIKVAMELKSDTGASIWKEFEWVATAASENDQGFSYDVYMKEPEKIRATLSKVSQIAVRRLFASLQKHLSKPGN
jgi:hypothetical protein